MRRSRRGSSSSSSIAYLLCLTKQPIRELRKDLLLRRFSCLDLSVGVVDEREEHGENNKDDNEHKAVEEHAGHRGVGGHEPRVVKVPEDRPAQGPYRVSQAPPVVHLRPEANVERRRKAEVEDHDQDDEQTQVNEGGAEGLQDGAHARNRL